MIDIQIAIHEAAHAAVAHLCGSPVEAMQICDQPDQTGMVARVVLPPDCPDLIDLACTLAGPVMDETLGIDGHGRDMAQANANPARVFIPACRRYVRGLIDRHMVGIMTLAMFLQSTERAAGVGTIGGKQLDRRLRAIFGERGDPIEAIGKITAEMTATERAAARAVDAARTARQEAAAC